MLRLSIVAAFGLLSPAQAGIINVGPGDSIQDAIDAAVDGDEIVVAPGTYVEAVDFLGKAITLRSSGGPEVTVIDGTGSFHCAKCVNGEGPDTVLDGFTLTGGDASSAPTTEFGGGGMFNADSSPTVSHCTFSENAGIIGGGMFNFHAGPTVSDCLFADNFAVANGAGMSTSYGDPDVIDCTFSRNHTMFFSGAGLDSFDGSPSIIGCLFVGNVAAGDGGGMALHGGAPVVTGCVFDANVAEAAGAMHLTDSSVALRQCLVVRNVSDPGAGAIATSAGSTVVTDCTIAGNAGGIAKSSSSLLSVTNSVLWGNASFQIHETGGRAAAVTYSDVEDGFPGVGNIDADPLFVDAEAGDYRLAAGSPCIDAADNTAVPPDITTDLAGNPRFLDVPETPDTGFGDPPIVDMGAYESLGGGCLALTGLDTVCHPDGTTFTLNVEGVSACTGDAASATFTATGGAVGEDLCFKVTVNDEQGRFCCSTKVCVEVPDCSDALGDLNGDGTVGVTDLLDLLAHWGPCTPCTADLNGDGAVGVLDLLLLLAAWGS